MNIVTCLWQRCWNVAAECSGQSTVKQQPCETRQRETVDCYCARQKLAFHVEPSGPLSPRKRSKGIEILTKGRHVGISPRTFE